MSRRTADIFSRSEHIRERMGQAYQHIIGAPGSEHFSAPLIEPSLDVYETEDSIVILVEIAGIAEEEIELEVEATTLTIRGVRKSVREGPRRTYSQMEIRDGPFHREVLLPSEVNAEAVAAVYKDGMLEISLPKAAPSVSRRLNIMVR